MSSKDVTPSGAAARKGLIGGRYRPLTESQIEQIHQASLAILARTGVRVDDAESLEIFRAAGEDVDGDRVRLSRARIEASIESAPSKVLLAGRDPANDLHLEDARVYIGTGGAALQVLDLSTGDIRKAVLSDVANVARLVDALEHIHFYLIPVYPTDLPEEQVEINKFYAALSNTTKHVQAGVYTINGIRNVVQMSARIAGGQEALRARPLVSFITSWMVSPLRFAGDVTQLLIEVCRQRMPVVLSAAPMAGSTAPITLAGMLAQVNAEQLAGLAFTQLVSPGCPVLIGPIPATADMRTGRYLGGSIELGMCNAAITQMAHFYQLPIYNSAGMTDAKLPDIQAGMEKAQSVIQVALAGANFIHHAAGMLEDMSTIAYEQYVIDNELLGMAMRAVGGIEVSSETLALDVIDRVGPGGHFLMDEHTLRHLRSAHHFPGPVFDRRQRQKWAEEGATDTWARAKQIAQRLLGEHRPPPIRPEVDQWIRNRYPLNLQWRAAPQTDGDP
jgi:trimethylamine--corrinoid protein Co-methyltransferase